MVVAGIITAGLYAALFLNQDLVNDRFTRGGWHALFPIVTALVFSLAHGTFTGAFWSVLGVKAGRSREDA